LRKFAKPTTVIAGAIIKYAKQLGQIQEIDVANKSDPKETATAIFRDRYPKSKALFLAGSVVRGEATQFSDLDLVVVFEDVDHAWRESFIFGGWPVEAFIHDRQTLRYFFQEIDAKSGCPSLPQMVAESIVIADTDQFAQTLKDEARKVIADGPPRWDEVQINNKRYQITDLLDDIRDPRFPAELTASGARLYELLADFYLRSNDQWSGTGKTIPRRLRAVNSTIADQFETAFTQLFCESSARGVIELSEQILKPFGGKLFEGYRSDAPPMVQA
jgi:hypothetical protein